MEVQRDAQNPGVTRREFFKTSALLGGSALLASCAPHATPPGDSRVSDYELMKPENVLYSVCLQCNTGCGLKVKLLDGVAVKLDGNPRAPQCLYPHLPADTSPFDTAAIDGALCPKGQAGLQTVYDPYRLRRVLKRAGKRGEGRWITIPFAQAIQEIVAGGKLFAHVPGEEEREVPGLRELWALRDPGVARAMAEDLKELKSVMAAIQGGQLPASARAAALTRFKEKHQAFLHTLIDPDHPDLGPKNNQFVFNWGRIKGGREHLVRRFVHDAFGSVNAHGHTTVCQGSLYFTGKAMSEQWAYDDKSHSVTWTGGEKFYWQADTGNSEFLIFVGASPFEANYGPPGRTPRLTNNIVEGKLKIAVVDPRLSKTAAKAWKWLPAKPGSEGALALALIRWVIENKRYASGYLANANKAAAQADGEPNWCNATWLVKLNAQGEPERFLRAHEVGLAAAQQRRAPDGTSYAYDLFVVLRDGQPVAVDPNDEATPVEGDLFVDTTLGSLRVKSALQLLYESASAHTIEEWAELCGLKSRDIVELADEFTKHGRRAAADIHRGVSQHTNGFYNVLAWYSLNLLIGNFDYRGGLVKKAEWNITGDSKGTPLGHMPFIFQHLHPHKAKPFGISLIRHEVKYEETSLFSGYPAKRPFYPLASDVYQEVIPSIGDQYPYPVKCLMLYMGTPVYALPAGNLLIPILSDPARLPLFVAIDITVGETSVYADYIFPDLSYLERWEFHGSHPSFANQIQPIRQPVVAPIPESVAVFGEEMPISLEAVVLALAERLGLPGFGPDGFGPGMDFKRPEDFYLKMVANVASGNKPGEAVPPADDAELQLFRTARRHLPAAVFDENKWRAAVGEQLWRQVVYLLNRGGRFEDYAQGYTGARLGHPYGKLINLYCEKTATTINAMTGTPFSGIARYVDPYRDCRGNEIDDEEYDLTLITYREITMTKSRTVSNYWLLSVLPEGAVLLNAGDAQRLGVQDGDRVRLVSASNPTGTWDLGPGWQKPLIGSVKAVQGLRPGVVAFPLGFGHWAYGSRDLVIDGQVVRGDPRRARGIHANAAMRVDPVLQNTGLSDPVGASVVFYETRVKVVRV